MGHCECWSGADSPGQKTQGSPDQLCSRTGTVPDGGHPVINPQYCSLGSHQSLDHGRSLYAEVLDGLKDIYQPLSHHPLLQNVQGNEHSSPTYAIAGREGELLEKSEGENKPAVDSDGRFGVES